MLSEPYRRFALWYDAAQNFDLEEKSAMVLSTADAAGRPSSRVLLLKDFDENGLVFFGNAKSRKGQEIATNPFASLLFYWMPLYRQIRIEGQIERISETESDTYFSSRERESQIGAWASKQSEGLDSYQDLRERFELYEKRFADQPIPRPQHWLGYRLVPHRFEFWRKKPHRLHLRDVYINEKGKWRHHRLFP